MFFPMFALGVVLLARLASGAAIVSGAVGAVEDSPLNDEINLRSKRDQLREATVVEEASNILQREAVSMHQTRNTAPASSLSPQQSIVSAGLTRTFYYYKPENFNPALGMVMFLHGGGGNGSDAAYGGTDRLFLLLSDRVGVISIFPDGRPISPADPAKRTWNDCRNSALKNCTTCGNGYEDVQFIRDIIPWMTNNINSAIDTTRVYVSGESEGGNMVERLALEANDVIAAGANCAGSVAVSNDNSPNGTYKCSGYTAPWTPGTNQAVPMFLFKGTDDNHIPYGSATGPDHNIYCQKKDNSTPPCPGGAVMSYYDSVAFWQWKLGISSSPTVQVADTTTIQYADTVLDCTDTSNFAGCDGSIVTRHNFGAAPYRLVFDEAIGGGHSFPGPDIETPYQYKRLLWKNRDALGQANPYIAEEMWAFFEQFTLAD